MQCYITEGKKNIAVTLYFPKIIYKKKYFKIMNNYSPQKYIINNILYSHYLINYRLKTQKLINTRYYREKHGLLK